MKIRMVKDFDKLPEKFKKHNKYKYEIESGIGFFNFASFYNENQFNNFCEKLGIDYNYINENEYTVFYENDILIQDNSFCSLDEIPNDCEKIMALSNGAIVECYFINKDNILKFYRPNPNYKDIYIDHYHLMNIFSIKENMEYFNIKS
ncbi:hypothetical protein [Mammaliicoccus sp. JADD-157]|uniref:hypothetical protein n=1 Tax=Mammaliicoccus sp. JADD-157 TaxID=3404818 RepID=UPI003BB69CB7